MKKLKTATCPTCGSLVCLGGKEGSTRYYIPMMQAAEMTITVDDKVAKWINVAREWGGGKLPPPMKVGKKKMTANKRWAR
jgi:hypothetical protein